MIKELKEFEIYCKSCSTIYHIDRKLAPGPYELVAQNYGKIVILRFTTNDCPFCTFEEDILKRYGN